MWLLLLIFMYGVAAVPQELPAQAVDPAQAESEQLLEEARTFLQELNERESLECTEATEASWKYASDITEKHKQEKAAAQLKYAAWEKESWEKVRKWNGKWETLSDPFLKRQFKFMSVLGTAALPKNDLEKYNSLVTEMSTLYSVAKICDYKDPKICSLALEPDLTRILRTSRDYEELKHVWKMWRYASGRRIRDHYQLFVQLANKAAKLNGFDNMGDMWIYPYESETFRDDMAELWEQLKPLYQQLHAYVRRKLRKQYGEKYVSLRGPIPAHLLGNMWSQSWGEIFDLTIPFPEKTSVDVTPQMLTLGYTPRKMFELSEEFFASLNLTRMPPEFWEHSIIEKPRGRELICHASAWDFCNGRDFRIKQCTDVTMTDLITVHHEMGHIEYYLQYKHLPAIFRSGANPGFHEAVGDVLALSVATPKHLEQIGLLDHVEDDPEADINFLMNMALDKIAFLPFGFLMDWWRWDVFSGKTPEENWNCAWWDLRYKLQGIKPPVPRSEYDFDPGAKYHIPANVPYIRYFVSFVIQFQFHKALCMKAGEYDPQDPAKPLHKCDIYHSVVAGNALGDMLQLGSSKEWPEAMAALTGTRKMDASVIREYFKPLEMWLIEDNRRHEEFIGWETDEAICSKDSPREEATSEPSAATCTGSWVPLLLLATMFHCTRLSVTNTVCPNVFSHGSSALTTRVKMLTKQRGDFVSDRVDLVGIQPFGQSLKTWVVLSSLQAQRLVELELQYVGHEKPGSTPQIHFRKCEENEEEELTVENQATKCKTSQLSKEEADFMMETMVIASPQVPPGTVPAVLRNLAAEDVPPPRVYQVPKGQEGNFTQRHFQEEVDISLGVVLQVLQQTDLVQVFGCGHAQGQNVPNSFVEPCGWKGFPLITFSMLVLWLCAAVALVGRASPAPSSGAGRTQVEAQQPLRQEEELAEALLQELDVQGSRECNAYQAALWNYYTDITEKHRQEKAAAESRHAAWKKEAWERVQGWNGRWQNLTDPSLKRQFKFLSVLGTAALPTDDFKEYNALETNMTTVYGTTKICDYRNPENCTLALEPELTEILMRSRNYEELEHVWKMWRDNTGRTFRQQFKRFITLANKAAILNGFDTVGDMDLRSYESQTIRDDLAKLWEQLKPLYQQLHAYVRRKLREVYGEGRVSKVGPIPAHLLGNMWAQEWGEIYDLITPYPNKTSVDITPEMVKLGYTPRKMFQLADEFFESLNMTKVPPAFWERSLLKKPEGRELVCHASAWDLCDGQDYRIRQCTRVNMVDLNTVHHEMGHVQYFLQYKHLPLVFRDGANTGFHEAVGDVLSLSVSTPKHLRRIGLLKNLEDDFEAEINFLLKMALDRVAFLPFGYLMDLWRWDVFSGKIPEDRWNCAWWDLRYELQGIKPPVQRSEEDFDPGAKLHIIEGVHYIRYFVARLLQFQFYKSLCLKAGEYDPLDPTKPLHKCDIYQSTEAGNAFGDMLQLGSSKPWPEALEALTGGRKMDASVMREYFRPLEEWLTRDNQKHGEVIGWQTDEPFCIPGSVKRETKVDGHLRSGPDYLSQELDYIAQETPWCIQRSPGTPIGNQWSPGAPSGNQWPTGTPSDFRRFSGTVRDTPCIPLVPMRHLVQPLVPGAPLVNPAFPKGRRRKRSRGALAEAEDLEEAARTFLQGLSDQGSQVCRMNQLAAWNYDTHITEEHKQERLAATLKAAAWWKQRWEKVCKWNGKWEKLSDPFLKRQFKLMSILGTSALSKDDLEETLTEILKKSRNYEELEHVWRKWRDNSGRPLRQHYKVIVKLTNKAAVLNGFDNVREMWLHSYESETFHEDVAELWEQMKPLYQQLHAYVRRKLREEYGEDKVTRGGPIPAHLLGNMWALSWSDVYHMTVPFPDKASIDITHQMEMQGYTPKVMFELSEEFFVSLNLSRMPTEFWENSIIQKPEGREMVCHANAWDLCNGKDFRIKQCTEVDLEGLRTVHHEMGHIQYFLQYKHLPLVFRDGANPGFHEAIGDVIALSVATPKHLHRVGLLENLEDDPKADINFLLEMALNRLAILPFGYLVDLWRWDVFSGQIPEDRWNCAWWDLRYRLQGIKPPVQRSEDDFDPGAKYHIATNAPYIRYFVSTLLQFQFHKSLCLRAGEYDPLDPTKPLHKCDIYQSTEAGNAFGDMLQLGSSKPWPEALEALTGERKMDASAIREYFRPLEEWLTRDNQQHGEVIGWQTDEVFCLPESAAKQAESHQSAAAAVATAVVPWAGLLPPMVFSVEGWSYRMEPCYTYRVIQQFATGDLVCHMPVYDEMSLMPVYDEMSLMPVYDEMCHMIVCDTWFCFI
ncbi:angiotensin-converting enzyme-like [Panulirus ornatus]|uniref:angiotensin-converting enzyme-like n=1 Tax=Panulirus ornatus TaxID=150431 RepID=UPI003A897EE3